MLCKGTYNCCCFREFCNRWSNKKIWWSIRQVFNFNHYFMDTYVPGINVIICPSILNKIERHFIRDVFSETNFETLWKKYLPQQQFEQWRLTWLHNLTSSLVSCHICWYLWHLCCNQDLSQSISWLLVALNDNEHLYKLVNFLWCERIQWVSQVG